VPLVERRLKERREEMQNQTEQLSYYEQIKADYNEALIILKELKGEEQNEARRSEKLLEKEM